EADQRDGAAEPRAGGRERAPGLGAPELVELGRGHGGGPAERREVGEQLLLLALDAAPRIDHEQHPAQRGPLAEVGLDQRLPRAPRGPYASRVPVRCSPAPRAALLRCPHTNTRAARAARKLGASRRRPPFIALPLSPPRASRASARDRGRGSPRAPGGCRSRGSPPPAGPRPAPAP